MNQVFNNPDLERQFDIDGAVIVDLFPKEKLADLQALLSKLREEGNRHAANVDSSYKLSFFNSSPEYRKHVLEEVGAFFQPMVDVHLNGYEPLIINVFDKEPGTGEVPIHQNWTFVDESKFTSVSVWIPLIDSSRENGTLEVVKGTHRVLTDYRSPSIPWVFENIREELKERHLEPLEVKVGQAGIIDDSIIHWSSENDSEQVRTAIQLIMVPREATPIHYYGTGENDDYKLEVFKVDSDFFTRFDMHKKPEGVERIGFDSVRYHALTEEEMMDRIRKNISN